MDVHMLFEVLAERKLLRTEGAGKAAVLHVRGEVAAQGKARCVLLIAVLMLANIGALLSHHRFCV